MIGTRQEMRRVAQEMANRNGEPYVVCLYTNYPYSMRESDYTVRALADLTSEEQWGSKDVYYPKKVIGVIEQLVQAISRHPAAESDPDVIDAINAVEDTLKQH